MTYFVRLLGGLARSDLKNVFRDPMLVAGAVLPLGLALLVRLVFPWLSELLAESFEGFDLRQYASMILTFLLLFTPFFIGWVVGFMLLEERDENILAAIAVTPLSKTGFFIYRLGAPVVLAFALSFVAVPLSGLPAPPLGLLACVSVIAASEAPILAAFLAAVAGNKVEGLALTKIAGLALLSPLACLLGGTWQYAAGLLPHFWVGKLLFAPPEEPGLLAATVAAAVVVHGIYLALFMRRFRTRMG